MKNRPWAVCSLLLLLILSVILTGCGKSGQIKDTETLTERETLTEKITASETTPATSVTVPDPEPDTTSIPEIQTDGNTESETETNWSDVFGMNRDEIVTKRGEGTVSESTTSGKNNSLTYQDKVAGYSGNSSYDFDESGKLTGITVTFDDGFKLDEILKAITVLYGESTEKDGNSVWSKDAVQYMLSEKDGKIVLTMLPQ